MNHIIISKPPSCFGNLGNLSPYIKPTLVNNIFSSMSIFVDFTMQSILIRNFSVDLILYGNHTSSVVSRLNVMLRSDTFKLP